MEEKYKKIRDDALGNGIFIGGGMGLVRMPIISFVHFGSVVSNHSIM